MSSLEKARSSKTHWRSLAELADSPRFPAFAEAEFPEVADPAGISRRRWLQLMGASLTLAGVSGCHWDTEEIVPFAQRPDDRIPGEVEFFATAMELGGSAFGLLVTSRDGRPIKIEGNPDHPDSLGAAHSFAQASVLQLYDPDRSRNVLDVETKATRTWDEFLAFAEPHFAEIKTNRGRGLAFLAEPSSSPTLSAVRSRVQQQFPEALWCEYYPPLTTDQAREGSRLAFGKPFRVDFALDKADVLLCLDCDLLGSHPAAFRYARQFAQGRAPASEDAVISSGSGPPPISGPDEEKPPEMNRLYVVESRFSITGANADHRLPMPSRDIASFTAKLEDTIAHIADHVDQDHDHAEFADVLARDLFNHRGRCLVAVGSRQPPEVHAAVARINQALGNAGKTVLYREEPDPDRMPHVDAIRSLAAGMNQGQVRTLVILGGNPVYDAPADLKFAEAYAKVPVRLHLGLYLDETAKASSWHLPQSHFLESWGDGRAFDGTYTLQQPLIAPLYDSKSTLELLETLSGNRVADGMSQVKATFAKIFGETDLESKWAQAVHDGVVSHSQWEPVTPEPVDGKLEAAVEGAGLELVFCPSAAAYDGRFANSSWLQEMPEPMTKITWDNAALFSPETAREKGIETDTLVRLSIGGRELEMAAYVMPGQARDSVTIALGYGRTAAGQVGGDADRGVPTVGFDTYTLRTSESMHVASGLEVTATGKPYPLSTTQDHHVIDAAGKKGRDERIGEIVREGTLEHYLAHPDFAQHAVHHPPLKSLWEEWSYENHKWGMSIDLTKCIGCNACMVACQAENNVPVVGKELVQQGREMHWIRVDRYFAGDEENPQVAQQVVACHQCENAPCEQVCPVAATVHSHEGLNDMVYNRCIGTRYCANNCPYKVRRFNYFYYHKDLDDPNNEIKKMVFNPDVTVRTRGVMEKCTYCVQRIQAGKIDAKNERRDIRDGEIRTACQQACPAQAIQFGDLNDARSRVVAEQRKARAYQLLAELNVKPRTTYLAKIRNPHPDLEVSDHEHDSHSG